MSDRMHEWMSWSFVVSCVFGVFPTVSLADSPDSKIDGFVRVIAAIEAQDTDTKNVWKSICNCDFSINTERSNSFGRFELVLSEPQRSIYMRVVADANESGAHLLLMGPRNLLYTASFGRHFLHNLDGTGWVRRSGDWGFSLDADHLKEFFGASIPHTGNEGVIRLDLPSFLNGVFGEELPNVRWVESVRTIEIQKENGTRASLRLRTPDDQLRFGTPLSEVALISANRVQIRLVGFIRLPDLPLRFASVDVDAIADTIGAETRNIEQINFLVQPVSTVQTARASHILWRHIFPVDLVDPRTVENPDPTVFDYRYQQLLLGVLKVWPEKVLPSFNGKGVSTEQWGALLLLTEELNRAYLNASMALSTDWSAQYVDDPSLVWRGFELAVGPLLAKDLIQKVFLPTVESGDVPFEVRVAFTQLFGRFGPPPWWSKRETSTPANENAFCSALLKSYWQLELSEADIKECARQFGNESVGVRHAAVEALTLAGHLEQVPREHLNALADTYLRQPGDDTTSWWTRHCKLHILTTHPNGRAFLVEQLESGANSPLIKKEMVTVLTKRVLAARQLKRYDFMSIAEANRIVTAMNATMKTLGDSQAVK